MDFFKILPNVLKKYVKLNYWALNIGNKIQECIEHFFFIFNTNLISQMESKQKRKFILKIILTLLHLKKESEPTRILFSLNFYYFISIQAKINGFF